MTIETKFDKLLFERGDKLFSLDEMKVKEFEVTDIVLIWNYQSQKTNVFYKIKSDDGTQTSRMAGYLFRTKQELLESL